MKILLTGSGGILGRRVVQVLAEMLPKAEVVRFSGDLTEPVDVAKHFQNSEYDAVIHLAALVSVPEVNANPARAYEVNVGGTINLIKCCQSQKTLPYFLYASSAHVYAPSEQPIPEDGVKVPISLYGKTKYWGEQIGQEMCEGAQQPFCAARMFSLWDENQVSPYLYGAIKARLETEDLDQPFLIHSADSQRDFSSATELANMLVKLLIQRVTGVINLASGKGTKIRDFAQSIADRPLNIQTDAIKTTLIADVTRLKQVLS